MKKIIITTVALSVIATSAFSQGLVTILAGASAATRMSTNSVIGGPSTGLTSAGAQGTFYYALFASSTQTSINGSTAGISGVNANYVFNNLAGWTYVGLGTNTAAAGRVANFTQASGALNADGSMTVPGINGGNLANLVVVAWNSVGIGSTLAALESWYTAGANGGWIGQSGVATGLTLGDGGLNGTPNPFGTGPGQVGGILMGLTPAVPEPTTMALAALGGASLLLFRRKK